MSQQPPPEPHGPSEPTQPMPPSPTAPQPQVPAAQQPPAPAASTTQAAQGAPPAAAGPTGAATATGAAQGPPPGGPGQPTPAGFGGPPPGRWQRATATTGRRWALAVVAAVVALVLVAVVAATGFFIGRRVAFGGNRTGFMMGQRDDGLNGNRGDRNGQGNGQNRRPLMPGMPGGRLPSLPGSGAAHGEYTVQGRTVVFQSGQVTALSSTSITLRSDDSFTQTYTITSQSRVRGMQLGAVRAGDTAFVIAAKDTREVVLLTVMGTQGSSGTS